MKERERDLGREIDGERELKREGGFVFRKGMCSCKLRSGDVSV